MDQDHRAPPDRDSDLGIEPYAEDEDLLERVMASGRPEVRVTPWRGPVTVVLGRGSRASVECHLAACRSEGVPVLRRRGGGCAVVLDPGNVIVSAVLPVRGLLDVGAAFGRFTSWVLDGIARVGLPQAVRRDRCDLCVGDRKIGGAALYLGRGVAYYSTTILHAPRVDLQTAYLQHPPREPAYRRGRSHAEFVSGMESLVGGTAELLATRLATALPAPAEILGRS